MSALDFERLAANGDKLDSAFPQPTPEPLPPELPSVEPFPMAAMPDTLRPWVQDVADRLQCPPDFVAVPMLVAAASLAARVVAIRPQARTDWAVPGNLWALMVGRPGMMKSPALAQALAPIQRLEGLAGQHYAETLKLHRAEALADKLRAKAAEHEAAKLLKKDKGADVAHLLMEPEGGDELPPRPRYIVSDATYEKLGAILAENPAGVLTVRDEVRGLLVDLAREEQAPARGFYLQAWSGGAYTFDRIGRGTLLIPDARLSMVGGIQPGPLAELVRLARAGKADDGMLERFLICWPDTAVDWRNVDRWPDSDARRTAFDAFERLDQLTPEAIQAQQDHYPNGEAQGRPYLRFDAQALEAFTEWRTGLESRVRTCENGGLEAALSKFRHHIPGLALALHLAGGHGGPVGIRPTLQALTLSDYFESHARRLHSSARRAAVRGASRLLERVKARALPAVFTARDVMRKDWSGLTERQAVADALDLLVTHGWLMESETVAGLSGGRPTTIYSLAVGAA